MYRTKGRTLASLCTFLLIFLLSIWYLSSIDHKAPTPPALSVAAPKQPETQLFWHAKDTEDDSHPLIRIRSRTLRKRVLQFDDAAAKGCARLRQMDGTLPVVSIAAQEVFYCNLLTNLPILSVIQECSLMMILPAGHGRLITLSPRKISKTL